MKKAFLFVFSVVLGVSATAQELTDAQKAAAAAAAAIADAPLVEVKVEKPNYWDDYLKTDVKFSQTSLNNWAAGGDNTMTMQAYIDASAKYKKNEMFWNNRLQLDYGFIYASSKPILQKNKDQIYLESRWGYKIPNVKNLSFSIDYDFKSQFSAGYDYLTPSVPSTFPDGTSLDDIPQKEQVKLWKQARKTKSGFLSPAYTNLAVGIDVKPTKWLSLNIAPLTGGVVIVRNPLLRKNYSMELRSTTTDAMVAQADENLAKAKENGSNAEIEAANAAIGELYNSARFELGAKVKADMAVNVNKNFKFTSQLVLFSNYLDNPQNLRVNWDTSFDWKLARFFSLTFKTNFIYDDKVLIYSEVDDQTRQRVQFKEFLQFGFTYTITNKK